MKLVVRNNHTQLAARKAPIFMDIGEIWINDSTQNHYVSRHVDHIGTTPELIHRYRILSMRVIDIIVINFRYDGGSV